MIWIPELTEEKKQELLNAKWGMFTPEGDKKVAEAFIEVVSWGFDPNERGETTERIQDYVAGCKPDWVKHEFNEVRDTVVREVIAIKLDELALSRSL